MFFLEITCNFFAKRIPGEPVQDVVTILLKSVMYSRGNIDGERKPTKRLSEIVVISPYTKPKSERKKCLVRNAHMLRFWMKKKSQLAVSFIPKIRTIVVLISGITVSTDQVYAVLTYVLLSRPWRKPN